MDIAAIAARAPVIPVLTIESRETAVPLARALVKGGLPVLEITLRTEAALDALKAIAAEVPEAIVGAGTVLNPGPARSGTACRRALRREPRVHDRARQGGTVIRHTVPAGCPDGLRGDGAGRAGLRAPEVLSGRCGGRFDMAQGGRRAAGAISDSARPAGSTAETAPAYLALANVACVGGSWVAPRGAVATGDWQSIERLAAAASTLKRR